MPNQTTLAEQAKECVQRILKSEGLKNSPRLTELLWYIIEEEIEGRGQDIKAYSIGIDVLGKSEKFDPQTDPIVRVTMGRLRTALKLYYLSDGKGDSVEISLPKGTYRPLFLSKLAKPQVDASQASDATNGSNSTHSTISAFMALVVFAGSFLFLESRSRTTADAVGRAKISVAILESTSSELGRSDKLGAASLVQLLRAALARNIALDIAPVARRSNQQVSGHTSEFHIVAGIPKIAGELSLSVDLIDNRQQKTIWSRVFSLAPDQANAPLRTVASKIAGELNTRILGAVKRSLENRDPNSLSPSQLFWLATWVPGPAYNSLKWEKERVRLARLAVKKDARFGPAYSVIADKLAFLAGMEGPSNNKAAIEEARESYRKALELSPNDPNTVFNVAQAQWHLGELAASIRTMKRVLELNPSHSLAQALVRVIPYTCSVAPSAVLNEAITYDQSLGRDSPIRWLTLTWLGSFMLMRGDFRLALEYEQRAAQIFQVPKTYMRRALVMNILGQADEAAQLIRLQKTNWPNTSHRHFSNVTIPRLCSEVADTPGAKRLKRYYEDFSKSMDERLPQG